MASWLNRTEAGVGDTVVLRVEITGGAFLRLMPDPEVVVPDAFDVLGPQASDEPSRLAVGLPAQRTLVYRLVAAREGRYRIPAVELAWFDPETREYGVARAESFDLTVGPAGSGARRMRINGPRRGMRMVPALAGWSCLVPILAVWPLVAPVAAVAAQTPSARVRLEPPEVTVGGMLRLVLEIRGVREVEQVVRPGVRGFSVPGLPLETMVGVRVGEAGAEVAESSLTLSYQLVARSVGSHDVGPFRITADGRTIETEAVTVRVVPREDVGVTVVARVEPPRVRVGESFRLRAEIRGSSLTEHEFVLPDVFDFADSGGGSLGSHERSWSLRAEVPGVFVVPTGSGFQSGWHV